MADHRHHGEGEHHQGNVAMPPMPGSALVVIEPELVFRGLKAVLDRPAMPFDFDQRLDRSPCRTPSGEVGEIAVGDIEQQLRRAGKGYVLGVSSAHVFQSWGKRRSVAGTAADIARTRRASDWKRLSAGAGTKGPRLHDWCYLELADLGGEEFDSASHLTATSHGLWTRGLLIRRHIADGDLAFFTTWCPAATSIETLVAVEGRRWAIEDSFETAKNEFGLDHNESRSWHGWHRHVSLVTLAFAMMAVIRHRANPPPPKKTQRRTTAKTTASSSRH